MPKLKEKLAKESRIAASHNQSPIWAMHRIEGHTDFFYDQGFLKGFEVARELLNREITHKILKDRVINKKRIEAEIVMLCEIASRLGEEEV